MATIHTRRLSSKVTKRRQRPPSLQNKHKTHLSSLITPSPQSPPSTTSQTSPMTISITRAFALKTSSIFHHHHSHSHHEATKPLPIISKKKDIIGRDLDHLNDDEFVGGLVMVLENMMRENYDQDVEARLPDRSEDVSVFYSTLKQPFGLGYYVGRLVKHMGCSRSVFIAALVYLTRVGGLWELLKVCEMNVHRLLIVGVVMGCKWLEDEVFCNEYYQRVGGVPSVGEFNKLEKVFLEKCGWKLTVGVEEFGKWEKAVVDGVRGIISECDSD